jgi:HEPN domain-containing protein
VPRDEEAARWFRLAADDLKAARVLVREGLYHFACFHAQQSAEKALKAYLIAHQRALPRQHHLNVLLQHCFRVGLRRKGLDRACKILDQYYLPTRYPDAVAGSLPEGLPMRSHAVEAVHLTQALLRSIRASC